MFYLNCMKLVFASFHSEEEILEMEDSQLKAAISQKMQSSFEFIFPYIPKNLLKSKVFDIQHVRIRSLSLWLLSTTCPSTRERLIDSKQSTRSTSNSPRS